MATPIRYIDRITGELNEEQVYFGDLIAFLYGHSFWSRWFGRALLYGVARADLVSALFGWWNRRSWTKKKIGPFIEKYAIDPAEFAASIESFSSFDDFFTRKLTPSCRPIVSDAQAVIMPADARYLCYQNIELADGFFVKGKKFALPELLQDDLLAQKYAQGTLVIARLCPVDYHRFHFPIDCTPGPTKQINGYLYSVNPIAVKENIHIFSQNKRCITTLHSPLFGEVLFIEVGATNVGSIHQTYTPDRSYEKGEEKGFFSFGASTLLLLFEPGRIQLDADLIAAAEQQIEIRCLLGQRLGRLPDAS